MPTKPMGMATLEEFYVNDRFFVTSCDLGSHSQVAFCLKKDTEHRFQKMPEVRIKQHKMLKDLLFFKLISLTTVRETLLSIV